jgi:hypothetical protein
MLSVKLMDTIDLAVPAQTASLAHQIINAYDLSVQLIRNVLHSSLVKTTNALIPAIVLQVLNAPF